MSCKFLVNFIWDVVVEADNEDEAGDKAYGIFKEQMLDRLAASVVKHCNTITEEVDNKEASRE